MCGAAGTMCGAKFSIAALPASACYLCCSARSSLDQLECSGYSMWQFQEVVVFCCVVFCLFVFFGGGVVLFGGFF